MTILILGNSNLFQRKIFSALKRFKNLDIELASKSSFVKNSKVSKNYCSYSNAIKESKAKIVYISLINSEHYKWALKSLQYNKHVIVDKPLSLNFNQSKELLKLAKKKKLLLSQAIVFQYHEQFKKLLSKIYLKKMTKINTKFHIPQLDKKNFRNLKVFGGGCYHDMSVYAAYLIYIFFKNKKFLIKKNYLNKKNLSQSFYISSFNKNIFLNSNFSFNSKYENFIKIDNNLKSYHINYAFSPPINKSLKLTIFDQSKKKMYKISTKKQNTFYPYFDKIFKSIKNKKYTFFYNEIEQIEKIKKKIS